MRTGRKPLIIFCMLFIFVLITGIAHASWVYIPYKQMIAEADLVLIGRVDSTAFRWVRANHITYRLWKVQPLYYLKGENQGGMIYVGTPNRFTSLHFDLDQWGSQVLLILKREGKAFAPRTPQGVIAVNSQTVYPDEESDLTGSELLQRLSITDARLSNDEKQLIQDYIGSLEMIEVVPTLSSSVQTITIIIAGFIIALIIAVFAFLWRLSNRVINIRTRSQDEIKKTDEEEGISGFEWYQQLKKEQHWISSAYGYDLYVEYIPVQGATKGTVVFSHGVTMSHITSIKYMRLFYEQGYHCLVYDHRRHGRSGGKYTTYGYYEKYDLQTVVEWLEKTKGFHGKLGIHGESMGAAIVLLYAGMGGKADFYIADCPYTTILDQLLYRMKVEYKISFAPLMHAVSWIISLRAGFALRDVNCLEAAGRVHKPVLFIHGSEDDYVPTEMCKSLFDAKPEPRGLYLVPNAGHARAFAANPEEYGKVVFSFINRYFPDSIEHKNNFC
jgi:fermentation-respiration switch protein FrsA (DUF1100 family)